MTGPDTAQCALSAIAEQMADGTLSAHQIYATAAARHAAHDDALHAYRSWAPAPASGRPGGRLFGIPVSLKDNFGVAGLSIFAGTAQPLPPQWKREGSIVAAIRREGGVIIGKTQMTEFALSALGANPYGPVPRNPWDERHHRSAGGSSSGAGVSLAEGSALLALGTDTMGSVRIPASVTGAVGLKTSVGRWPTDGIVPLSPTFDTVGLLARSVADAAYGFAAIDPASHTLEPMALSDMTIGIADSAAWTACDASIAGVVKAALDELARAGAAIRAIAMPEAQAAFDLVCNGAVAIAEFDAFLAAELPQWRSLVAPATLALAERGAAVSARRYLHDCARHHALTLQAVERFAGVTVIAAPTVPLQPPILDDALTPAVARRLHLAMLRSSCVANCLGLCAVTLPVGLDRDGIPVGLELLGPLGGEERIIAAALAFERVLGPPAERLGVPPLLR